MADRGLIRALLRGVYVPAQAPDSIRVRAQALGLVIPDCAVVTDRAAGWLHGMPVLRRGAHLEAPPIEVCHRSDTRSVRPEVDGHRRILAEWDLTLVHGIRVTTVLRTALDLGRLSWKFDALAALDAAVGHGVDHDLLVAEVSRFKGYRGVRQLRWLVTLADGRAESPGESALRLHWHQAGLPWPEPQVWIVDDDGVERYRLDLALPGLRYAAEYDGVEHHSSDEDREYDAKRREWLRNERGWLVEPFGKDDVYRPGTDIEEKLWAGFIRARRSITRWQP